MGCGIFKKIYLCWKEGQQRKTMIKVREEEFDVVVVGTGAAGLFATLSMPDNLKVLMITKDEILNSDSYLAQGGICVLKEPSDFDSFYEDTMKAGHYENRAESVRIMIENSPRVIERLVSYGVDFEKNSDGTFDYTREGGHSTFRILHHEDVTGKEITSKLFEAVKKADNITFSEHTTMMDLITDGNSCHGIVAKKDDEFVLIYAKEVILATGGIGGLFKNSTNFSHISGDSFAIALKHDIELENINYIQIHPTIFYENVPGRKFLISESVRGEGAILIGKDGKRFTDELQPRDVVTAAEKVQMEKDDLPYVRLSFENIPKEEILSHFPNIYNHCKEAGYDITKEPIPVTPAQHYLMGGIHTDTYGRTTMEHLYAVGETACNGVHGANRLASNSLLESLIFGERAGYVINEEIGNISLKKPSVDLEPLKDEKKWKENNKKIIMNEIKRKDKAFYDKWCKL